MRYSRWLLLMLLSLHNLAQATPLKVALLGAPDAVQSLRQGWQGEAPEWVDATAADVLITLGEAAFTAAAKWQKPRLALDLPATMIHQARQRHCRCSGVFLQPDPLWQLKLIHELFSSRQRVALLYAARDEPQAARLAHQAPAGVILNNYPLTDMAEINQRLASILENNDLLLLLPASDLFNAESARFILLSSYRLGRPVIGPDAAFVKAGSLASVAASNASVFAAIEQQLHAFATQGAWLAPVFPAPEIVINDHVAHAFDLDVTSPAHLLQRMGAANGTR